MKKLAYTFTVLTFFCVGGWFSSSVWAQTKPKAAVNNAVKVGGRYYRKKTVISFGNDTIKGDLTRPDGEYIEARKSVKLGGLIRLRSNWKKKISQAINDL